MNDILKPYLVGTVARGIMWGAAAIAGKLGIDSINQDTANGVASFVVAAGLSIAALAWSWYKNRKLLQAVPPPK